MASKDEARDEGKENMWSSLLDGVASGKQLPEKLLLVIGGSAELQKDFLETLGEWNTRRNQDQHKRRPPISNELALGYTYQDVLDADHEDTLARLSIYTLQEPNLEFAPLVRPLITVDSIPESLAVILLDWEEPWHWLDQIRNWISFLYGVVDQLDREASDALEANSKQKFASKANGANTANESNDGQVGTGRDESGLFGEWKDAFGLPLSVVCHNANKIDSLERDYSWREEEFDYLLQFLRTILLNYGASLIYTSSASPNSLPLLIQSSLSIHSPLRRETLKHNVVDRDRILIPPQWDSWGKIKVIREGFDVEGISKAFSTAMQTSRSNAEQAIQDGKPEQDSKEGLRKPRNIHDDDQWRELTSAYEEAIRNPKFQTSNTQDAHVDKKVEVASVTMQEFLGRQSDFLEKLRIEEERTQDASAITTETRNSMADVDNEKDSRINQQIGPVQFNMGGIQVDAEDMLKTLRQQDREETPVRETGASSVATPDGKQNEALASFFAGLIKKGGRDNSPKPTAR